MCSYVVFRALPGGREWCQPDWRKRASGRQLGELASYFGARTYRPGEPDGFNKATALFSHPIIKPLFPLLHHVAGLLTPTSAQRRPLCLPAPFSNAQRLHINSLPRPRPDTPSSTAIPHHTPSISPLLQLSRALSQHILHQHTTVLPSSSRQMLVPSPSAAARAAPIPSTSLPR